MHRAAWRYTRCRPIPVLPRPKWPCMPKITATASSIARSGTGAGAPYQRHRDSAGRHPPARWRTRLPGPDRQPRGGLRQEPAASHPVRRPHDPGYDAVGKERGVLDYQIHRLRYPEGETVKRMVACLGVAAAALCMAAGEDAKLLPDGPGKEIVVRLY